MAMMAVEMDKKDGTFHRKEIIQRRQTREWVYFWECWWFTSKKLLWLHLKAPLPKNHLEETADKRHIVDFFPGL